MMSTPQRGRLPPPPGSGGEPGSPVRPPTAFVVLRRLTPSGRRVAFNVVGPVGALSAWRIDNSRNMATRREHEARLPSDESLNAPCRVPRNDMILLRADGIHIQPYPSQVEWDALELYL